MAANTSPVFPLTPNLGVMNALLSTAMTNTKAFDGTEAVGTAMVLCFTAGSDGARLDRITVRLTSTNGSALTTASLTATLVRFWVNNGSVNTIATNNQLLGEVAIPAASLTSLGTSTQPIYEFECNLALPAGYKIYAGLTVATANNTAVVVCPVGGNY